MCTSRTLRESYNYSTELGVTIPDFLFLTLLELREHFIGVLVFAELKCLLLLFQSGHALTEHKQSIVLSFCFKPAMQLEKYLRSFFETAFVLLYVHV